jgi:small-conductance mechanosensitive channel
MKKMFICGGLLFLSSLAGPAFLRAATTPLSPIAKQKPETQLSPQAATALTDENIDQSKANLESRLDELRLQSRPEAIAAMQEAYRDVAKPEELKEWEKLINRLIGILDDHVNALVRLKNVRKANHDRAIEMKAWQGFAEKPPYSLSFLDGLRDAIRAEQISLQSLGVMRSISEGEFEEFSSGLKRTHKQVRLAEEDVEKSAGKPEEPRKRWLLTMARLRDEVNQAGIVRAETQRLQLQESLEGTQDAIRFLERKLAAAQGMYRFSEEDLEQKLQTLDLRREQYERELEQAEREEDSERKALQSNEEAVRKAQAGLSSGKGSEVQLAGLLMEHEVRQASLETAALRVQILKGMLHLMKNEQGIWRERYRLAAGQGVEKGRRELESQRKDLDLVARWQEYVTSKRASLQVLIRSQQVKLSAATLPEADRLAARRILAAYQEQDAVLQRGDQVLAEYAQLTQRRNEEMKVGIEQRSLKSRARGAIAVASALVAKIWNAELYVAEETIIAEGKKIVRPRSVTIGKLVEALIILLAGAWVARRLTKLFRWFATKRLRLGVNDAQLYSRMLFYLMIVGILVGALIFVNIPLAVFAFFGGALAIGIGFGGQNLVNNFISGLILMFDHTIRMGDIVEVDGQRGRVTSIGMRSSSIKRFDGVEMLVPNSHFLQQNVTNWTASDRRIRFSVSVGVVYGAPTEETAQILLKAVEAQPEVLNYPLPYVVFENFADSSLTFTAYFWIEMDPAINSLVVCSDIRHRITARLREAGIAIPFPQRDLHVDAGQPIEVKVIPPDRDEISR